jgi:hypothetical protein
MHWGISVDSSPDKNLLVLTRKTLAGGHQNSRRLCATEMADGHQNSSRLVAHQTLRVPHPCGFGNGASGDFSFSDASLMARVSRSRVRTTRNTAAHLTKLN